MKFSSKALRCQQSPMRKFHPYAVAAAAAGKKIYHLNIGQPDIQTPKQLFDAVRNFHEPTLAYAPSPGIPALIDAICSYYARIGVALDAGDVDAFCVDKSILANYKTDGRSFIADSFSPQEYGVATKKGSELSAKVEELITGWLADGTIDGMIAEWGLE